VRVEGVAKNGFLNVSVRYPEYIKYGQLTLENQPDALAFYMVDPLLFTEADLTILFRLRNYCNAVLLVLSFGVFNRVFEESNVLTFIAYGQSKMPNALGTVFDLLRKESIYYPLPVELPYEQRRMSADDLQMAVYEMNVPIVRIASQLILLAVCGLCLVIYIRNYLSVKRNPRQHKAFRNIMDYSSEYMLENWICVLSALSLPVIYQFKLLALKGFDNFEINDRFNLILSICLVFASFCLVMTYFFSFSPKSRRYSVLYF
jgi:hypothetical protein